MIGVDVGVGFGFGVVGLSPAWLHSQLAAILGADLLGLWIGEDLVVDGSNQVTSWPGRVGPTLATAGTGSFVRRVVDGRAKIYSPDSDTARWLTFNDTWPTKAYIAVAKVPSGAGVQQRNIIGIPTGVLLCQNTDDVGLWYTAHDWSHFRNGVASEDSSVAGLCVYEADHATGATGVTEILGRSASAARTWTDDFGLLMALSAVPSAGNRAAAVAVLLRYYRI